MSMYVCVWIALRVCYIVIHRVYIHRVYMCVLECMCWSVYVYMCVLVYVIQYVSYQGRLWVNMVRGVNGSCESEIESGCR